MPEDDTKDMHVLHNTEIFMGEMAFGLNLFITFLYREMEIVGTVDTVDSELPGCTKHLKKLKYFTGHFPCVKIVSYYTKEAKLLLNLFNQTFLETENTTGLLSLSVMNKLLQFPRSSRFLYKIVLNFSLFTILILA